MPAAYEAIRDKFKAEGMSDEEAKRRAAKIYNAKHKEHPVTNNADAYAKGGAKKRTFPFKRKGSEDEDEKGGKGKLPPAFLKGKKGAFAIPTMRKK